MPPAREPVEAPLPSPPGAAAPRRLQLGINAWLLVLTFVALVPLFIFSAYAVLEIQRGRQEKVSGDVDDLAQRSQSTTAAVGERLDSLVGHLQTLASSDAALNGNLQALFLHAQRMAAASPGIVGVALVDRNFRLAFSTPDGFDDEFADARHTGAAASVFATGQPAVSGHFAGAASGQSLISIGVPVARSGRVAYCLLMVVTSESLNQLLARQRLPPEWMAGIVDQNGTLVARTHRPERYVGGPISSTLAARIARDDFGVDNAVSAEGIEVKASISPIGAWGWKLVVGVPRAVLDEPLSRSMIELVATGLTFAALGLSAGFALSGLVTRNASHLAATSRALISGRAFKVRRSPIAEFDDMAASLTLADRRARQISAALSHTEMRQQESDAQLLRARTDSLTGLARRGLFLEQAQRLVPDSGSPERLALLFVDLDDFKRLNDRLGHEVGDQLLGRMAGILRTVSRSADVLGRLGGDEFVVAIRTPADAIVATAEAIARRVIEALDAADMGVGCSIGIAQWMPGQDDMASLLRRADEAMYGAKKLGKNRFMVWQPRAIAAN